MLSERCKVVRYTAVRTREAGSVLLEHSRMSVLFGAIALHTGNGHVERGVVALTDDVLDLAGLGADQNFRYLPSS